jgi:hypothetical protein
MKVVRPIGSTLVAILAVGSFAASSSSASLPEFSVLPTNKSVTADSFAYTGRSENGFQYFCLSDHYRGVIVDANGYTRTVVLGLDCVFIGGKGECTLKSVGAPSEGSVETTLLTGLLGSLRSSSEGASLVGVLFTPSSGKTFVKLAATGPPCESPETTIEGDVAGEYSPVKKSQTTAKIVIAPTTAKGTKEKIGLILTVAGLIKPKLTVSGEEIADETTEELTYGGNVEVT